jgi:hypothetical protein
MTWGSLYFAFLQHSGGRRRFLFIVLYYNSHSPEPFLCCERLLLLMSGLGDLLAVAPSPVSSEGKSY